MNNDNAPYPMASITQIFTQRAIENPHATAIKYRDEVITYQTLNRQANALAASLLAQGVKQFDIIPIAMDRTPELITSLLAILKVGAVYLPIDKKWPIKRIQTIVEASSANYLIISAETASIDLKNIHIIPIGNRKTLSMSDTDIPSPAQSDDLAYINFTSGSSGTPKGVMIPHKGVVSLLFNTNYVPLNKQTVTLQLATPSFDAMTFELWGALLHGGTCVLYDGTFPQLSKLENTIRIHHVNTVFLTTALFNIIIDESLRVLEPVKYVLTGGEAHSVAHIRKAHAQLPKVNISSVYGPTEATTFATHFPLKELKDDATTISLGKSTNNREVVVVDEQMNLCSLGKTGEILIAGAGLADGYLGREELTKQCFIPLTLHGEKRKRFYKTGDLGRYDSDGNIDFLGRKDSQIKLNGFRIELEEIEGTLIAHQHIKRATVLMLETNQMNQLHAAIVTDDSAPETLTNDLSRYLSESLPTYMIPTQYHIVASLPMTATGKVDRKILQQELEALI